MNQCAHFRRAAFEVQLGNRTRGAYHARLQQGESGVMEHMTARDIG